MNGASVMCRKKIILYFLCALKHKKVTLKSRIHTSEKMLKLSELPKRPILPRQWKTHMRIFFNVSYSTWYKSLASKYYISAKIQEGDWPSALLVPTALLRDSDSQVIPFRRLSRFNNLITIWQEFSSLKKTGENIRVCLYSQISTRNQLFNTGFMQNLPSQHSIFMQE